jgi:hypothetical protein
LVIAATGEGLAIRTKSDGSNLPGMSEQGFEALTRAAIPKFYDAIATTTSKDTTIRTEGDRPNPVDMFLQNSQTFTRINIP